MTATGGKAPGLKLLEQTLEIYGADRTRWPAHVRRDLSGLTGTDSTAQRMVKEAEAFDRLLDLAPLVPDARIAALAGRIAKSASTTPRLAVHTNEAREQRARKPASNLYRRANAAAGLALAASLLLGIFAGGSQSSLTGVQEVAAAVGLDNTSGQIALGDDTDAYANEDLL